MFPVARYESGILMRRHQQWNGSYMRGRAFHQHGGVLLVLGIFDIKIPKENNLWPIERYIREESLMGPFDI